MDDQVIREAGEGKHQQQEGEDLFGEWSHVSGMLPPHRHGQRGLERA
jgi:hypothetical protein